MDFGPNADTTPPLSPYILLGTLTHSRHTRAVLIPMTAVSGCLIFAMFGATSPGALVAFAILYGFFSGGCACAFFSVGAILLTFAMRTRRRTS